MVRRDDTSSAKDEQGDPATGALAADSPGQTVGAEHGSLPDQTDLRSKNRPLERGLWIGFGVLFVVVLFSMYLPVKPIVFVFPLWSVLALAAMVASVVVAALAGVGYGWPEGYR